MWVWVYRVPVCAHVCEWVLCVEALRRHIPLGTTIPLCVCVCVWRRVCLRLPIRVSVCACARPCIYTISPNISSCALLQMRRLRIREVEELVRSQTARKRWTWTKVQS